MEWDFFYISYQENNLILTNKYTILQNVKELESWNLVRNTLL